ncbi:hypothetical protein [Sphingomonas bacterium]|uniref:hypothetical protein n=1 Tax=Sphingomonas bacterium TaxID=1895847 RepID=UPI0026349E4E|nr:hypothetical protein [Sphingomonas bacterium]MDB5678404.1 hypothetical protein [Sphingomonas bacterium]
MSTPPKIPVRGRPGFSEWVERHLSPNWPILPLTHITRGLKATDILRNGKIEPQYCDTLKGTFAFFFYGRPAYRCNGDKVVKLEASCPQCFIFKSDLLDRANQAYGFDTGAFGARMYSHVLDDDFDVEDFKIGTDRFSPNKLISATFESQDAYLSGDPRRVRDPASAAEPHEMEARSYLELLTSPGRNEPDDRICSIEIVFADPVKIDSDLLAIVVPHTLWNEDYKSPALVAVRDRAVEIIPFEFIPNRHPEHYQTLVELAVREFYRQSKILP